ncbi:E3 ubiquitin/ISG15 ligase TRIM25 isoform X2 [Brienomyrus brachyistius]|uniref:E3 ubiquitin/ISG15 ligase TRIM25 isoform X1 n=1 Tax=Brienomyrus brachyistius TaxID=42636 RepID=UPI0020B2CCCE|nr:E3 ubiquitin/ISG15 ligase TRIM25 isoform X1 [Brienomyrus brachyistius]XP_048871656.1 E3 ubiquitin/ISG15 ligase TRIM25 isoform X2 [Brienomyrus brachyistius]
MAFEEYETLKVLAKHLECCICLKIFLDPVTSFCGRHNYCEKCLTTHLGRNAEKKCPECRESFRSDYKPQRNITLCKIVDVLGRQDWQDILSKNEHNVSRICSDAQETKLDVPLESVPSASLVQDIKGTLDPTGSTFPVYREQPEENSAAVTFSEDQNVSEMPEAAVGETAPVDMFAGCYERLTFSPLLGHGDLAFFEGNRRAEVRGPRRQAQAQQHRFSICQVMAEQEFTGGTRYWHVDSTNSVGWAIGVAYSGLGRDDRLGRTAASWCLEWTSRRLSYWHNNTKQHLDRAHPSRITVWLDMDNGQLSFYSTHDSGPVMLHSVSVHFQEPVRPTFWLYGLQRGNCLAFTGP